jgi:hypothetical protein
VFPKKLSRLNAALGQPEIDHFKDSARAATTIRRPRQVGAQ